MRTKDSLIDFTKIISQINPTENFQKKWKKLNRKINGKKRAEPLKTIKASDELYRFLFEVHYQQWMA